MIDLPDGGGYVFAFDAADLTKNIERERRSAVSCTARRRNGARGIRRLKQIGAAKGYPVIPGHELPDVWPALLAELTRRGGAAVPS